MSDPLEKAIKTALWYLDASGENPAGAWSALCYSTTGGEHCMDRLRLALEPLKATGLTACHPDDLRGDDPLAGAIRTALWYLDDSEDNPNAQVSGAVVCVTDKRIRECEDALGMASVALLATGLRAEEPEDAVAPRPFFTHIDYVAETLDQGSRP